VKRIRDIFKYDVSLKVKLICSYLVFITVLLSVLGVVLYNYYLDAFIKQASESAYQLTDQINKNIESYFEEIDQLSLNIAYDDKINKVLDDLDLDSDFANPADEQGINDQLYNYLLSKNGVDSIHIYTKDHYFQAYKRGTINELYHPSSEVFYTNVNRTNGRIYIESRTEKQFVENFFSISIGRPILSLYSFKPIGTLVVDVNNNVLKDLINDVRQKSNSMIIILNEKDDQVLYSEDSSEIGKRLTKDLFYNKSFDGNQTNVYDENKQKYLFISQRASITNHRIVVMIPYSDLTKNVNESSLFIIDIGVILLVVAFLIGILITNTITKPIKELQNSFRYVGKSSYGITKNISGKNEISQLWMGFNTMVKRIKELIDEIIGKENEKRRAELNALQMQINPHFLYNTLNSIKYLSIIQNANNIKRITDLLISLLKELANNQADYITIRDEINIVKKYIEIQKAIYLDKFSVSIICPKDLYTIKIIKFILQPIIENSIFHGILPCEKKGKIRIRFQKKDYLIIKIIDNGVGLKDDQDWENTSKNGTENNHIGLNNINHRIKLFYGDQFGISVKSKRNIGTVVQVILPYQIG
jgi:two-component system sensor histidine kinase YesM